MLKSLPCLRLLFCFFGLVSGYSALSQDDSEPKKRKGVDIIITQSPKIIITLESITNNTCFGEKKGAVNISAEGGYPPYQYYWSHEATTQDVAGLKAGNYRVAVYDGFSCSDTLNVTINEPTKLQASIESVKDILCFGYNQGEIDISVKGGVAPYRYSWSNGLLTEDLKGVTSGEYSVLVTDANNCQEIITASVKETPLIVRSVDDVKNILCFGDKLGEIDISVQGGSAPYSYSWNNGATTQDISDLGSGDYEVTVTDAKGCSEVSTARVVEPKDLLVSFDKITNVRCFGDVGGAINIHVEGGVHPYVYDWNNGATTQDIAGVKSGLYKVDVVDANGCKNSIETEMTQPVNLEVGLVKSEDVSFYGGENGSIDIEVNGGVAPYKYKWNNGATKQDVSKLTSGNYNVKVSDATGCSKLINVTLTQPSPLVTKVDRVIDVKCNGNESGQLSISVNGGVEPYTYLWSSGEQTEDITMLGAGKYSVLITDANGHQTKIDTVIMEPKKFVADIHEVTHILCNADKKGRVDVEVSGGVEPYKYHWSNGMITQDIVDVPAGAYSVKIIDANRCELELSTMINQPEPLDISFSKEVNILCFDNNTGAISVAVTGGEAPYTYAWNNGAVTQDLNNIKAGEYQVTVRDKNGCEKIINTKLSQPEFLIVREGQVDNIDCFGNNTGQINLNVSGGKLPYQYVWNTKDSVKNISQLKAGRYTVEITDVNGCLVNYAKTLTSPPKLIPSIDNTVNNLCYQDSNGEINITVKGGVTPYRYRWNTGATSQDVGDLKMGTYQVEIKDTNGCIDSLRASIKEAPLMESELEVTNILCHGSNSGSINLSVVGGVAPYKYNWSNGAITQDISNLPKGEYSVVITDANGCSDIKDVLITEPTRFIAILESESDIKCYGQSTGAIDVRVSGGIKPYTYLWNTKQTTQNLSEIPSGNYKLTVKDANGCTQLISSTLKQPSEVKYIVNKVTDLNCYGDNGGSIDISITGGVGPYKYNWSDGSSSQDLVNAAAGKYSVEISEGNGCENVLDAEIKQPPLLTLSLDTVAHVLCNGNNTGLINVSVNGGVAPFKYSWSNGAATKNISNLIAGKYTLTVTDANGCIKSASTLIKEPRPFEATLLSIENIKCNGDNSGKVTLNVIGGVKPYNFKWNDGSTTQNLENLVAGSYNVLITDANGCTKRISTIITEPKPLKSALVASANISCKAGNNGSINISVTGGATPYSYIWNNGARSQDLNDVPAGTYSVKITDSNGCENSSISVTLTEPEKLVAQFDGITNILTYGLKTGAIDLSVNGGVSPYKYSWSNGATLQDISSIPAGNYSVHVVDALGCEVMLDTQVTQPPALMLDVTLVTNIACSGENSGAIDVAVSGGVMPYKFQWSHGDSTQNIASLAAGDYALTVVDANNHRKVVTAQITEPTRLKIKVDQVESVLCNGAKTGAVSVTVTGGISPFKYSWSNGATSQDLLNISAGEYELLVTDKNGCTQSSKVRVDEPEVLIAKIIDIDHVKCNGDNEGGVRVEVTGGATPYRYSWSNGEKTQNLSTVIAGTYSVKISDANGCVQNLSATISQPSALQAEVDNINHNSCFDQSIGSITLNVSGGSGSYSYSWSNGDSTMNISSLAAGDYDVIIKDSLGCVQKVETIVTHPEDLVATVANVQHIDCFGDEKGSIDVTVDGGTSPYQFSWSNGEKKKNLNKVRAGVYTLNIQDTKGCTQILTSEITQPSLLILALDTIHHNLCKQDEKGLVDITVSGGVTPYRYSWSNGEVTEDLVNVIADKYTVKLKDAKGCGQTLKAEVLEPELLSASVDSVGHISCNGDQTGYVSVNTKGGVAPYSYQWDNGSTNAFLENASAGLYEVLISDANGCSTSVKTEIDQPARLVNTIDAITDIQCYGDSTGAVYVTALEGVGPYTFEWSTGERTADITGLVAGTYKLKITQGNGCVSLLEAAVEQPALFKTDLAKVTDVLCFDDPSGAIDIDVTGGVEPYVYAWSNGEETQDISMVKADNYSVMVTDANGCLNTINTAINEPEMLEMNIDSVRNVKCCGDQSGAIFISVTGGVAPYEYLWSNGATSQDIENLILGRYTVNITDATGCIISSVEGEQLNLYEQVVTTGKFVTRGIEFDIGKTTIKAESFRVVNKIATLMKEHPDLAFRIDGHTDSDGTAESNQKLSEDRSLAIKTALVKFGIADSRLYSKGWGETQPIATNTTRDGKKKNRRVEFISLTGTMTGDMVENEILNEEE